MIFIGSRIAAAAITFLLFGCSISPAFISSQAETEQEPQALTEPEIAKITPATQSAPPVQKSDSSPVSVAPNGVFAPQDLAATVANEENSIYFTFASTKIDLEGQLKLRAHASRLKQNPDLDITLIGHTDNLGSRSYNQAIAERRTEEVGNLLRSYGVKRNQIHRYGVGNEKSDSACKTAACRRKMRQVFLSYPK